MGILDACLSFSCWSHGKSGDFLAWPFTCRIWLALSALRLIAVPRPFTWKARQYPISPLRSTLVEGHARRLQEFHVTSRASLSEASLDGCPDPGRCLSKGGPQGNHGISVEELVREGGTECSTAPRVPCSSPAASLRSPEMSAAHPHSRSQDGL